MIVFRLYQIRYFLEESKIIIPAKELWTDIQNLINENEILLHKLSLILTLRVIEIKLISF